MSILLVIPARGGSKGISRKNLQDVAGRPLIAHAIRHARKAKELNPEICRVIVSTEDPEIAQVAREWGADVPFMRPSQLAEDQVSLIPVVRQTLTESDQWGWDVSAVASLQPTAPLLQPKTIDTCIRLFLETGCDSVITVRRVEHNHPYRVQLMDEEGRISPLFSEGERFLQKQDLPTLYALTGGLYLRKRELLIHWSGQDFALGRDQRAVEVEAEESLDIDSPLDLALFRSIAGEAIS